MIRTLAFAPLVAAAAIFTMSPALAQTTHARGHQGQYQQSYRGEGPSGWTGSDPSFGYHPNLNQARGLGRCVEDLGYGRFEYCD
ncbi:MAG: hypothetical protein QOF14_4413 [Hyphomicrobiales bacterium]|nr:hypothetical protein [Hyphomicrobiales bacterium]